MTSTFTDPRHHEARFGDMPEGFTPHVGKKGIKPPIKGRVYIELVHKTDEGYGISPRIRADFVSESRWETPPKVSGAIVGWQLAAERKEETGGLSDFVAGHLQEMKQAAMAGVAPGHDADEPAPVEHPFGPPANAP